MRKLLFIIPLLFMGCAPSDNVDPLTGVPLGDAHGISAGCYEFEYKGHWFVRFSGGGGIHAPYCGCLNRVK